MKKVLSLFLFAFITTIVNAQAPSIKWQKCIGGSSTESVNDILPIKNGHYIVSGFTRSADGDITSPHGGSDIFVGETDSLGILLWGKNYGNYLDDFMYSITQANDSGYIAAIDSSEGRGTCILRLNDKGDSLWKKCNWSNYQGQAQTIITLKDSGYIFIGSASRLNQKDIWVVKLGNIEWEKTYGGTGNDYGTDIKETTNGYYLEGFVSGTNDGNATGSHGDDDIWFAKIDTLGNLLWHKCLGGSSLEISDRFTIAADSTIVLLGRTSSSDGDVSGYHTGGPGGGVPTLYKDAWMVKLSFAGDIIWQKCLGGTKNDLLSNVVVLSDGNIIAAGYTISNDGDIIYNHGAEDAWLVKVSKNGELVWQKTYGGSSDDEAGQLKLLDDNSLIFFGQTFSTDGDVSGNHGWSDMWLVKLDTLGVLPLKLLSFTTTNDGKTNLLKWSSTNEINTDRFEIQRSSNGRDFTTIGSAKSYNNGKSKNDYSFTDAQPLKAVNYYRLKMIDKDGKYTYSAIKSINNTNSFDVTLYPNPVKNNLTLNFSSEKAIDVQIEIVNTEGKLVLSKKIHIAQGESKQTINTASLNAGNYFLKCTSAEGEVALRFVKQ